ncbi:MAG: M48 family metalloprotease [Promethearchaeota archaeon]
MGFLIIKPDLTILLANWVFWLTIVLFTLTIEELYHWARNGKRSEMSDIIAIAFFFSLIFLFTNDLLTAIMGAFSIYLWVGIFELKEYPILNKILIISLVTYNAIFVAGLLSFYLKNPIFINTTFSFSFWIILGLGLLLFGRKYIVVWRFMSPQYLTLFLYIIAWLAVSFVEQFSPISFIYGTPIRFPLNPLELVLNIYFVLIIVNWVIYFVSGPILDKLLGIKRVKNEKLLQLVEKVKTDLGIKGNVKVGFGEYPILNAMAYGSVFDKRIAIIAEDLNQIPEDELKGIVAHELAHTKGRHSLILTLITVGDLVFRMFLALPATYYDYTFSNPAMPMIVFILLNILIYAFIYVFVRILEGRADLKSKKAGYATELVKALYNLESFYASGREIGLNSMLLCDEKISNDNKMLDYIETAEYLDRSLIKPSRLSLISNLLNSHPPTYFRIAAILGEDLKPTREALLPFLCLKKSNQKKYAKKFKNVREDLKGITDQKFKDLFGIEDFSTFLETIDRKKVYKFQLKKDYLFKHKITGELLLANLLDIVFKDNVSESVCYEVKELNTGKKKTLNSTIYEKSQVELNHTYFFEKKKNFPLVLKEVRLDEDKKNGTYVFLDKEDKNVLKPILKTKLPWPTSILTQLEGKDVFVKTKAKKMLYKCIKVKPALYFENYEISLKRAENGLIEQESNYKIKDLIIVPNKINISIRKNDTFRKYEVDLIKWLIENKVRCTIWLKKPVNNFEIGYIDNFSLSNLDNKRRDKELSKKDVLVCTNIFKNKIKIPYKQIEQISFEYDSVTIQKRTETSYFSKLGYKMVKKFKPRTVLIT